MSRAYHTLTVYHAYKNKNFNLIAILDKEVSEELVSEFADDINNETCGGFDDSYAWNNMEKEMCEFSRQNPDFIFKVHVEGDEEGALSDTYFHNGSFQDCPAVITYAPFDGYKLIDWNDEMNPYLQYEKENNQ